MTGFLLDTNVPSETMKPRPEPSVVRWLYETDDELLFLSVISIAEIFKGIGKLPQGQKRNRLESWIESVLRPFFGDRILPVTEPIAERLGLWTGAASSSGIQVEIADGIIAATALEYGLTVATRNIKDFVGFGVPIFNPWEY